MIRNIYPSLSYVTIFSLLYTNIATCNEFSKFYTNVSQMCLSHNQQFLWVTLNIHVQTGKKLQTMFMDIVWQFKHKLDLSSTMLSKIEFDMVPISFDSS